MSDAFAPASLVDSLARLHAAAFDQPQVRWSPTELSIFATAPGAALFVEGEPPQGFALARVAGDEAELLTIAVDTASRRRGVGARLMERVESWAVGVEAKRVFLEVSETNVAALALYRRRGWREVGRRRSYYSRPDGSREDAVALRFDPSVSIRA